MIRIDPKTMQVEGDPAEVANFMGEALTEQQMADIAGVALSTIQRWKNTHDFPINGVGRTTKYLFTRFMSHRVS